MYFTVWNPIELLLHLARWAGLPAVITVAVATVLGIYKALKDWVEFGRRTARFGQDGWNTIVSRTPAHLRATVKFAFLSVLAVAASYMFAVLLVAIVLAIEANPSGFFKPQDITHEIGVAPWPAAAFWTVTGEVSAIALLGLAYIGKLEGLRRFVSFAGWIVVIVAWGVAVFGGLDAAFIALGAAMGNAGATPSSPAPPWPFAGTIALIPALAFAVALLVPSIRGAAESAFEAAPGQARRRLHR
jgi:hypothetical protein